MTGGIDSIGAEWFRAYQDYPRGQIPSFVAEHWYSLLCGDWTRPRWYQNGDPRRLRYELMLDGYAVPDGRGGIVLPNPGRIPPMPRERAKDLWRLELDLVDGIAPATPAEESVIEVFRQELPKWATRLDLVNLLSMTPIERAWCVHAWWAIKPGRNVFDRT